MDDGSEDSSLEKCNSWHSAHKWIRVLHRDYDSYDLCFSSNNLPYKIIKSYGLEMRPPELNYYFNVEGNDLFLYDISVKEQHKKRRSHHYNLLHYDVKELQWIDSLFYTLFEWWLKLKKVFDR